MRSVSVVLISTLLAASSASNEKRASLLRGAEDRNERDLQTEPISITQRPFQYKVDCELNVQTESEVNAFDLCSLTVFDQLANYYSSSKHVVDTVNTNYDHNFITSTQIIGKTSVTDTTAQDNPVRRLLRWRLPYSDDPIPDYWRRRRLDQLDPEVFRAEYEQLFTQCLQTSNLFHGLPAQIECHGFRQI